MTYGSATYGGATHGGSGSPATASRAHQEWAIAPAQSDFDGPITVDPSLGLEVTPETITLTFDTDANSVDSWRRLDRAGDVQVETGFGGAMRAFDRSADGVLDIRPAARDQPPVVRQDMLVDSFSEEQLSPRRFRIEVVLQRLTNRRAEFDELDQTGAWAFDLAESGTVALDTRRVGRIEADGTPHGSDVTLPLLVTDAQAGALLDSLGFPAGVVEESIPDGDSRVVDESGGRQTISIDAPADAPIDSGDWLCRDWTLELVAHDDPRWRVELVLADA